MNLPVTAIIGIREVAQQFSEKATQLVRGEGYADYWKQKCDMHFMGFCPTLDGVSTYESADTLEDRWWAWVEVRGHRDDETGSGNRHRAPSSRRTPTSASRSCIER